MTQIPSGTKFVGIASTVPTPENRSSQNNAFQEVYTLSDIKESVLDLTTPPSDGDVLTYDTGTNAPVWAAPSGGSDYTETIVTIPSSAAGTITYSDGRPNATGGILGMGTSPIELLPAAGANAYYDIDKIIIEYMFVTTPYVLADKVQIYSTMTPDALSYTTHNLLVNSSNVATILSQSDTDLSGFVGTSSDSMNSSFVIATQNGTNPTLGDGTLRVKIYHKTITFGA